jgi:hypothetical protein
LNSATLRSVAQRVEAGIEQAARVELLKALEVFNRVNLEPAAFDRHGMNGNAGIN